LSIWGKGQINRRQWTKRVAGRTLSRKFAAAQGAGRDRFDQIKHV
jgi:hypothetical protein